MNRVRTLVSLIVCIVSVLASFGAAAKDLVVLCVGAVKPALSALQPAWAARGGPALQITYASAGELRRKLAAGEAADIVILPLESLAAAAKDGIVDASTQRDLGAVGIGVAVKEGASLPDLSSEDGLKRALLAARSVTFMDPERGTSGKHFDEVVLPRLGIRDAVRAKAVLGEGGMIAEKVARGEVEIAFQGSPAQAARLLGFLVSPEGRRVFVARGFGAP